MKKYIVWGLAVAFGLWNLWKPTPIQAQLFQNNNSSCEDKVVVGFHDVSVDSPTEADTVSNSIACGRFNDDTAAGNPDFPDCATQMDPAPSASPAPPTDNHNSILINTGAHGQNCVNAGEPNNQFQDAEDLSNQSITQESPFPRFGTIQTGNLDNGGFDDLAWVFATISSATPTFSPVDRSVQFLFSSAGGGFTPGPFNPDGSSLLGEHPPVETADFLFPSDFFSGPAFESPTERSLVLFDCDGDGDDDAATGAVVVDIVTPFTNNHLGFALSKNDGMGLLNALMISPPDFFEFPTALLSENDRIALTAADFDGDGPLDIMASVHGFGSPPDVVLFCRGNGTCGFDCPSVLTDPRVFDLTAACAAEVGGCVETGPTSIIHGDFDGKGLIDVAVAESLQPAADVRYLFNNGMDVADWGTFRSPQNTPAASAAPLVVISGKYSPEAFATNTDEVAVTVARDSGGMDLPSQVAVMTTDGAMGINAPLLLNFFPADTLRSTSLASKDFDHCGGDDIIALGSTAPDTLSVVRRASLFLNTDEAPVVTIDPNVPTQLLVDTPINIPTTCTDPTLDDRTFSWTTVAQPAGSNVIFGTPNGSLVDPNNDASTTFQADLPGTYTIQIDCTDFCGLSDTDLNQIQISFDVIFALTQGDNLFNCSLNPDSEGKGNPMIWMLLLMIPAVLLLYRFSRRRWFIPTLVLLLVLGMARPGFALTNSVYVNTFAPTVDDSEYFTIYGSPTMLQRNFHVGFFLDYAHQPYEFGATNFDRVSGIVDHLLDANVVGSYAVLNWFSVGLVIPVTLFEGINSPLLGLNESNFALGDVSLVLKFRLLDREKHHVGIAIVPFAGFPTSTNSSKFLGNGGFSGGAKLVIDGRIKDRVAIALNVGANMRQEFIDISGQDIDSQFLAGLGVSVDIIKKTFKWIGEVQTSTVMKDFFSNRRTTPAEARLGFRYTWANNHDINFGGGMGFSNGIGQPDFRAFVGYTYTKRPLAEVTLPPPPISEIQVGDELTLKDKIYFEFDKDKIRDISMPTLDKIAAFLKAHPEVTKIKIDGYTCDLGREGYNLKLSQRRANAAAKYLEDQGIDPSRVGTVTGHGEADPMVPNVDEAHREQNRRVQMYVEAVDQSLTLPTTNVPATTSEGETK